MSDSVPPSSNSWFTGVRQTLVVVVLAVGVIWLAVGQHQLSTQIAAQAEQMNQQTAAMNRALGVVAPEWEKQLAGLERRVNDTPAWPRDDGEAKRYSEQTSELIKSLPARAEPDYLPRLNPIRWAAMAFVRLTSGAKNEGLTGTVEEMNELAAGMPDGGSVDLQNKLRGQAKALSVKHEQDELAKALAVAKAYTSGAGNGNEVEASSAYEILGSSNEKDGPRAAEIQTLRKKLHATIVTRQAAKSAGELKDRWNRALALKDEQPAVYEASAQMMLSEVVSAHVALVMEGIKQSPYDELERVVRQALTDASVQAVKREEERQARAMREYQRWALTQIRNFDGSFSTTQNKANDNAHWYKKDNGGWDDACYTEVRDAMVIYLLPINLSIADPPVQERYQRAFQRGWSKLDGRDDQTYVAEQTASTVKKPLREFFEQETQHAHAQRAYEEWAMKQSEAFGAVFSTVVETVAKRRNVDWKNVAFSTLWGGWDDPNRGSAIISELTQKKLLTGWEDGDRERVRDALVQFLLPVNAELLGPWHRNQLQQAYHAGWNQLKPEDQAAVTEGMKTVSKKPLDDFLEKQP